MGCFKYCSLKTVADKMTAAIFILVREQGHLVGSSSETHPRPFFQNKECTQVREHSETTGYDFFLLMEV